MLRKILRNSFWSLILLGSVPAFADSALKSEVGAGFTSNAYLSASDAKSDLFTRLSGSYSSEDWGSSYRLSATVFDFSRFHDNDRLLLEGKFPWNKPLFGSSDWSWTTKLFWQKYFHEQAALGDASFDYFGGNIEAMRQAHIGIPWETRFGGDFDLTYFPDLNNRTDYQIRAKVTVDSPRSYEFSLLSEFAISLLESSLSEYNKLVVQLWFSFERKWIDEWMLGADVDVASTTYQNRHIGELTAVSGRRGKPTLVDVNERASLLGLTFHATKELSQNFQFKTRLSLTSQASNNEFNQYSESALYAGVNYLW